MFFFYFQSKKTLLRREKSKGRIRTTGNEQMEPRYSIKLPILTQHSAACRSITRETLYSTAARQQRRRWRLSFQLVKIAQRFRSESWLITGSAEDIGSSAVFSTIPLKRETLVGIETLIRSSVNGSDIFRGRTSVTSGRSLRDITLIFSC